MVWHPASNSPASGQRKPRIRRGAVFHFDVGLYVPLRGGLIVRYQGCVTPNCGVADALVSEINQGTNPLAREGADFEACGLSAARW
jgi:hypothetical protein